MKKRQVFEKRKKFIQELLGDPLYKPMRLREIASLLNLGKSEKEDLYDILESLLQEGKAEMDSKGRYKLTSGKRDRQGRHQRPGKKAAHEKDAGSEKSGAVKEGIFIGHPKGFGFVEIEGEKEDIFIPEEDTGTAVHHDRVKVLLKEEQKEGKRREGVVTGILERGMTQVVGTYQANRDYGFVVSDNPKFSKDVFIPKKDSKGVKNGDKVIVSITDYGSKNKSPEGKVLENLGNCRAPGTDILAIVKSFGIPSEFPERVLNQAMRVPDHVLEADFDGRIDLRDIPMVTIDGEDAKDLDDAVSLSKENGIYHLGVHIADVSNYVQGGSALDREAL